MSVYISVDSGTTNTRIALIKDKKILKTVKYAVGASKGIGDRSLLRKALKEGISGLLNDFGLTEKDVTKIIASGMITCEFGLCNLPHIDLPAGLKELSTSLHTELFEDICSVPFTFVRGVKCADGTLYNTDMVRGEETELMGLFKGEGTYLLAGSHTKLMSADKKGNITGIKTLLTGELIAAVSGNTILKDAVDLSVSELDEECLLSGYNYAAEYGMVEALFKVRILKNIYGKTPSEVYSFFMGVMLSNDVEAVLRENGKRIFISGTKHIRRPIAIILKSVCGFEVTEISDEISDNSIAFGQMKIIGEEI